MKVIIAGSRTIADYKLVEKAVRLSKFNIDLVVSGGARGVDILGEQYAARKGIPIKQFPALWVKYGKSAGFKRNIEMAQSADALIAVRDKGISKGTDHMIATAEKFDLKVFVLRLDI